MKAKLRLESETQTESETQIESETQSESETSVESETQIESETQLQSGSETQNEMAENQIVNDDPEADRSYRQNAVYDSMIMPFSVVQDQEVTAYGIDVSQWNGDIDWEKVAADGVDFAIIRVAYRGYGTGKIVMDEKAIENLEGATEAGIGVGAYFFSTALTEEEAVEEAQYLINVLKDYNITYPVAYDCEGYEDEDYRNHELTKTQRTDNAIAFLKTISDAGYNATMYGSQFYLQDDWDEDYDSEWTWETSRINSLYNTWVAQYFYYQEVGQEYPSYESIEGRNTTYDGDYMMWQFTSQGVIDGISGYTDLNLYYGEVPSDEEEELTGVPGFVSRLYTIVLDRKYDAAGLQEWVDVLVSGETTGAEVVRDFILSPEFTDKNVSDEEYIEILYNTCMDRKSDAAGKAAWLERLNQGFSRLYVLRGFIESDEFTGICEDFGIVRGNIPLSENRDQNDGVTRYVSRCYEIFLDRKPDVEGLNDWTGLILADRSYAAQLPDGFIGSDEFVNKNLSNEEFVRICYRAILDRNPDQDGLNAWVRRLEAGDSRREVLAGFTDSDEFKELLADYGL